MKNKEVLIPGKRITKLLNILTAVLILVSSCREVSQGPGLQYTVSMPDPANHLYHVVLECSGWSNDTIDFKMPQWMPGYYQIMEYSKEVSNLSVRKLDGNEIPVTKTNRNTWSIILKEGTPFSLSYDVRADRKFVANSYLDTTHGYIVPAATFMYINCHISTPVMLRIESFNKWNNIATGLDPVPGKAYEFTAPDFDILYDCPILLGNLEVLPSFEIGGVPHRFIAYNPDSFDHKTFISGLEKTIKTATDIIGDIPYSQYTFIGIGPGFGGIEHLNNTTVSFSGKWLDNPEVMKRVLKFLAHEYFHHYNVKRIRPFELGPFDYDREDKTYLLWVSEGLTVYYEYLIVKRAGVISEEELLASIADNINAYENDPGRNYQSLSQASFNTWSDGPFGNKSGGPDMAISYYDKGPVIGMILDFSIRDATQNSKSLDDVMRFLYLKYYKNLKRGFTDAEFQQACEEIAGVSLNSAFEYVYTTKEIDYATFLSYAGLKISEKTDKSSGRREFKISRQDNMNSLQISFLKSWSGG